MAKESDGEGLFKNIRYYVIGEIEDRIEKLLVEQKAKVESYLSGLATHALVTDYSNIEIEEAQDVWQIPTVTVKWVELSSKCSKLLPTEAFLPSTSQLFSGLVICPSKVAKRDRDLLWSLVTFYGGVCRLNLSKSCTHLVVTKPEGKKYEEAVKHSDQITTVTPDWITDSVKLKSLQDVKKYHPSLIIVPEVKPPSPVSKAKPEEKLPESATKSESSSDAVTSSLQKLAVSSASVTPVRTSNVPIPAVNAGPNQNMAPQHLLQPKTEQESPHLLAQVTEGVAITPSVTGVASATGTMLGPSGVQPSAKPGPPMQTNRSAYQPGQIMTSVPGQVIMAEQHHMMQMQVSPAGMQQMQRPHVPGPRFTVPNPPQRFVSPTQTSTPRPASQSPRKPTKRRRSSNKSKNATSTAATVPTSPAHGVMMSQQQMHNAMLHQQNQQMLMNQHRMMMQQTGQPVQTGFIQPQMLQQQHIVGMQVKGQVTPQSPQKMHTQHVMVDQTSGGMGVRPGYTVSFANNPVRMQQVQQRPMQPQTQMSPQMMMGLNPQMQVQQQQTKMQIVGPQGQQHFMQQQPGVAMPMTLPLQNQQQSGGAGKVQQQRMQISPQQQQAMFIHHQGAKDTISPRQPSPMGQQQIVQQQGINQQQQLMMQQMARQQQQQQLQMQQQLMQSPGPGMQVQQKMTTPPNSHAPINVSGIGVISPTALQQGLMLAQAQQNQGFQQPLIHPSLQAPQDYGKVTPQSGGTKSRRSKSRRTKDGDENAEAKPKSRSRGGRKKSSQSPAAASSPGGKKAQTSPSVGGFYQTPMNVMTPPPHPTVPVAFSVSKPSFPSPASTVSPLAATENTPNNAMNTVRPVPIVNSPKVETHFLPQYTPAPTPPPPHRGPFFDPLEAVPKSFEGRYYGHDPAENVPQDLCLLGCVFVIIEYQETVPDLKTIEHWKKIINKFGGIVEDEYNACTCTHLLCISQSTTSYRDSLLEGKRCVTVYWLNDVLQIRELRPPWLALHVPTPYSPSERPAVKHTIGYTGFHQKERERLKMMASTCGAKFSGFLSRSNTVLVCKGTLSLKYDKAREWKLPCVNVHWLRDVMLGDTEALNNPNLAKYQNFDENATDLFTLDESKMQQILDPWKVPVRVTLDCMQRARVKRKHSASDAASPALKRPRIEGSYQPLPRVCFTGLPSKQVTELQKTLESLQGQVSRSVRLSTHLVAKCISRTVKFLCAMSTCQYIVTPEWIEESAKSNWLLDEDKYLLRDKLTEEKFDFSLQESLRKARKRPLFKDYVFCMTERVTPDRKTLTDIIECAGGKVISKIPDIPMLKRLKSRKPPNNRLLLISCPEDEQQVIRWKREGIAVHNAEIVLSGVLKQEVDESLYRL